MILVDRVTSQGCSQLGRRRVERARNDLGRQGHITGMLAAGEEDQGGRSKE